MITVSQRLKKAMQILRDKIQTGSSPFQIALCKINPGTCSIIPSPTGFIILHKQWMNPTGIVENSYIIPALIITFTVN